MVPSIYLRLTDYNGKALISNGQSDNSTPINTTTIDVNSNQLLRVNTFSSDVEQTLNIGSQSTGAGAGKITFNPMMITKQADAISPVLFQMAASGTPFKTVEVFFVSNVNSANMIIMKHTYKLVAVKTISWSASMDDTGMMETISFEYGGLLIAVNQQTPDGKLTPGTPVGWNRIKNVLDNDPAVTIK